MKTTNQTGSSALSLLLSIGLVMGALLWLLSDYLPADATDVQAVVASAASSQEAKKVLAEALKETPNPNRAALNRMRGRVNEVLGTETARAVTGDKSIESPSEREVRGRQEEAEIVARLTRTPWREMILGQQVLFVGLWLANALPLIGLGAFFLCFMFFGYSRIRIASNRRG